MTETDAEFIAEIKALAEKATKEPWDHVICDDNWQFVGCSGDIVCHQDPNHSKLGEGARSIDEMDQCNFAFIAAARSAIPRLIGMVEERERESAAVLRSLEKAERERDEAREKRDQWQRELSTANRKHSSAECRAAAAESAQREAVAEVARLREALEHVLNPQAVSAFGYRHIAVHALAYPDWSVENLNAVQARAALASKE